MQSEEPVSCTNASNLRFGRHLEASDPTSTSRMTDSKFNARLAMCKTCVTPCEACTALVFAHP